jgi:hypothetical protein
MNDISYNGFVLSEYIHIFTKFINAININSLLHVSLAMQNVANRLLSFFNTFLIAY